MYFTNDIDPVDSTDCARSAPDQRVAFRKQIALRLRVYKAVLLEEFGDEPTGLLLCIRQSVNEAEGLAWSTPYAHLLLPALIEEKIQYVRRWTRHQHRFSSGRSATTSAKIP